jgi:hypothetical protein
MRGLGEEFGTIFYELETYHTRVEFLTIDGVSKDAGKNGVTLQLPSRIDVNGNES